jgi:serine/threonine protein kinase
MTERDIFLALLDLPDQGARAAFLDGACGGDGALRARVAALLRSHDNAGSFLGTPAVVPQDPKNAATQELSGEATPGGRPDPDEALSCLTPPGRPDSLGRIGHYEVLEVLGRGGFGIVFRALDERLQRVVAVKVLAPQIAATSPARKRFLREARSSAAVRHENVVQVHAVEERPLPYLVMEFIPGETLQQRLDRTGPLEVPEILQIGVQIARGLAAAHEMGLIHRDIKPGNILIEAGPQPRARITDFGLARAADDASLSQSGLIAGTPMFMSPEQAKGETLDHRTDLFSLGSVLYTMATGRPPFRANGTLAVLKRVAEDTPRDIREIIPETPPWLCDLIAKLHAKDPAQRFQSAREVADVLADCEARLKVGSELQDFSRIPRSKPPARSGKWKWVAAAAMLLPLIAFAVYALTRPPQTETAGTGNLQPSPNAALSSSAWHGWPAGAPAPAIAPFDAAKAKEHQQAWAKYLGVPVEYMNSIGMKFTLIPPGEFLMGSTPAEVEAAARETADDATWELHVRSEAPRHRVILTRPFYLGALEVTQGMYGRVTGNNPSYFTPAGEGKDRVVGLSTSTFPVEQVSWLQAVEFCAKLSRRENLKPGYVDYDGTVTAANTPGYRLPTEAEWEFACRAGATTRYGHGDRNEDVTRTGWHRENAGGRTHLVGQLEANPFGLYDMEGNVWEWVQDWWHPNAYGEFQDKPAVDPAGPAVGTLRVVRGGSWPNPASCCRSSHRFSFAPTRWGFILGFRVMLPLEGVKQAIGSTDADGKRIAALPAAEQVEEVRKELTKRNPDFDGMLTPTVEGDAVTALKFATDHVTDISPVRALTRLRTLEIEGPNQSAPGILAGLSPLRGMQLTALSINNNRVTDLSPLRGMPLRSLWLHSNPITDLSVLKELLLHDLSIQDLPIQDLKALEGLRLEQLACIGLSVTDLSPLKGMSLKELSLHATAVSDLSPLMGMPLESLNIHRTKVSDLSPLKGMPLGDLNLRETQVTDLSPLKALPLKKLQCDFRPDRDAKTLREIKTLEEINGQPAADFWKEADRK